MKTMTKTIVTAAVASVVLVACSTPKSEPNHLQGLEYPEWVLSGSGAVENDGQRLFQGVGSVSGVRNHALARTTAANRGRNELAKVFEVYSASLMKDYMASTTAGDMSASSEEQHVEQAIKTFTAQTLSGVEVTEYWFHPDGTVYALAQMRLDDFAGALAKMKELSASVRDYVRRNAERVHMDLEKEEEKAEGR